MAEEQTIKKENIQKGLLFLTTIYWMASLAPTDSYYIVYLILGLLSLYSIQRRRTIPLAKLDNCVTWFFALLFSLMVTFANHSLITEKYIEFMPVVSLVFGPALFLAGGIVFRELLLLSIDILPRLQALCFDKKPTVYTRKAFFLTFAIISVIDLIVLLMTSYPGILSVDSVWQIRQIETGVYSNHHPYYHTQIIKLFYSLGLLLGNKELGIFLYCIFQIATISAILGYANATLHALGSKIWVNIVFTLSFLLLPYHLYFSFTLWKDILFSGSVLLFLVSSFRLHNNFKTKYLDMILWILSSFGFCLLRSNGWLAYGAVFVMSLILFPKKWKSALLMVLILALTFVLKNPVLERKNVTQPDLVESLSIPVQQIARVIKENKNLTEEERALLSQVVEVERIPEVYLAHTSDNIKDLVRKTNNQQYLEEHIKDYLKLYLNLGKRYPSLYLKAWIDETRGYYNGGYSFWIVADSVEKNDLGISSSPLIPVTAKLLYAYTNAFRLISLLQPFVAVGLHVWMAVLLFYLGIMKRKSLVSFLTVPTLSIILTLLVATPVFCEFRYAYAIFVSNGFLMAIGVKLLTEETSHGSTK